MQGGALVFDRLSQLDTRLFQATNLVYMTWSLALLPLLRDRQVHLVAIRIVLGLSLRRTLSYKDCDKVELMLRHCAAEHIQVMCWLRGWRQRFWACVCSPTVAAAAAVHRCAAGCQLCGAVTCPSRASSDSVVRPASFWALQHIQCPKHAKQGSQAASFPLSRCITHGGFNAHVDVLQVLQPAAALLDAVAAAGGADQLLTALRDLQSSPTFQAAAAGPKPLPPITRSLLATALAVDSGENL